MPALCMTRVRGVVAQDAVLDVAVVEHDVEATAGAAVWPSVERANEWYDVGHARTVARLVRDDECAARHAAMLAMYTARCYR